MTKYVCAEEGDNFYTNDEAAAMDHLNTYPEHQIVSVSHDYATGNIETRIIETEDTQTE
ncbi:MAG: hypothetical protein WC107_01740 [Patescibacteria group bacterium]